MKYSTFTLLILSVFLISCEGILFSNDKDKSSHDGKLYRKHNSLANNFSHKGITILDEPFRACNTVIDRMDQVVEVYIVLGNALAQDNPEETDRAIALMARKVSIVPLHRLDWQGFETWQNHKDLYQAKLKEMLHIKGIENKRASFSHISEIMYCTIKSFGLKHNSLYVTFCPMAFDGKGAYWISADKNFRNPYFGSRMPDCGVIKEVI